MRLEAIPSAVGVPERLSDLACGVRTLRLSVLHTVTRKQFDEWLVRPSGSPAETAQRNDLRVLLEVPKIRQRSPATSLAVIR
jgi:hypothetical protein